MMQSSTRPRNLFFKDDMVSDPLAIVEILELILRFLDQKDLAHAVLVSRSWRKSGTVVLWRHPTCYRLSESFIDSVVKYGYNMVSLNLYIDLWAYHKDLMVEYFGTVLKAATRLRRLRVRPAHDANPSPRCVLDRFYEAIMRYQVHQLMYLSVNFTFVPQEVAADFFASFSNLKALDMPASRKMATTICASPLELEELQLCPSAADTDLLIDDAGLAELGQWMSKGKAFVARHFLFKDAGVHQFLSKCTKTLTRIAFAGCSELTDVVFQQIVESLPLLEQIDFSDTKVCDLTILKLAQVARAPQLKDLIVSECAHVTSLSIRQIVTCCKNLEKLDCEGCPYVQMNIFAPPMWFSRKIQHLMIGAIHQDRAREGQERPPPITEDLLSNMYDQIGQLKQLRVLSFHGRYFPIQLFSLGRMALESLPYLASIDLATMNYRESYGRPLQRDCIWLATRLPHLTHMTVSFGAIDSELRKDLQAINTRLEIEVEEPPLDDVTDYYSDGIDDSDDDSDHYGYDYGFGTFRPRFYLSDYSDNDSDGYPIPHDFHDDPRVTDSDEEEDDVENDDDTEAASQADEPSNDEEGFGDEIGGAPLSGEDEPEDDEPDEQSYWSDPQDDYDPYDQGQSDRDEDDRVSDNGYGDQDDSDY